MTCHHFDNDRCKSCVWMDKPYPQQLSEKEQRLQILLGETVAYFPTVRSKEHGFRNKAKMMVLGTVDHPILGIVNHHQQAIDLSNCPLYPASFFALFEAIKRFIKMARLTPYQIQKRKGELKYVLLHYSEHENAFALRFVLRSSHHIERIQQHLDSLLTEFSSIKIVSVNIQPVPMAIFEGDEEVVLVSNANQHHASVLEERLNGIPFYIRPQGFFQTNTDIAKELYITAQRWVSELAPDHVVDLFCGAGGFGLHCLNDKASLIGYDISAESVASAQASAEQLGVADRCQFFAQNLLAQLPKLIQLPDVLLVNPPRRGLGENVTRWVASQSPRCVVYSSCNAETMAKDIQELRDYRVTRAQIFDMFPHTEHFETLALLLRN